FSNYFFAPDGRIANLASSKSEREAFLKTDVYARLKQLSSDLRKRDVEAFETAIRSASGRLTVIVPKSLHAALREEANREGVSMAELIRVKLACPLSMSVLESLAGKPTDKRVA